MDRNQKIGLGLIAVIVIAYTFIFKPSELPEENNAVVLQDTSAVSLPDTNGATPPTPVVTTNPDTNFTDSLQKAWAQLDLQKRFGLFAGAAEKNSADVVLENNKIKLFINTNGGYVRKAVLKGYTNYENYSASSSEDLVLFDDASANYSIEFQHNGKILNTKNLHFTPSKNGLVVNENEGTISFQLKASNGGYIEYTYGLKADEYLVDFNINIVGLQQDIVPINNNLMLSWIQSPAPKEKSLELERQIASIFYYSEEDGRDYLSERSKDEKENPEFALKWVSFKQQYFSTILLSEGKPFSGTTLAQNYQEEDSTYIKNFSAQIPLDYNTGGTNSYDMAMYLGPNDYKELDRLDHDFEQSLNLGIGIIRWVNQWIIYPIFKLFINWGISAGIAIILLTFAIKLLLFPITYKNYLSSAKMRVIKPHLEKINKENENADPMKKQQAVMALYKQTGVNPLAGCLPALLQMPILYALFRLFPTAMELRHQSFLWVDDLSSIDDAIKLPFSIPMYGDHVSIFTILMAISMFFYMRFNQQMTPQASGTGGGDMQEAIQKNMKVMMNIMPVFMLFIFNNYATGLSFYYFIANVVTIGQTISIKKWFIDEKSILEKIENHMTQPMKKSRWQRKIEEMQAKQKR